MCPVEEGQKTYWSKRVYDNKDEDNSLKTLNDNNEALMLSFVV